MKKLFFLLLTVFAFSMVSFAQEALVPIVKDSAAIAVDSPATNPIQNFTEYTEDFRLWFGTCGVELQSLIKNGKVAFTDLSKAFTGAPLPTSPEGVTYWTDTVDWIWAATRSVLTAILVFWFSLFKSKDEAAEAAQGIQKWFDGVKTRYLLMFTAPIVTLIGLVAFKGQGWTWIEAIGWTVGTGSGALLFAQILDWLPFKFNLNAKKVKTAQA